MIKTSIIIPVYNAGKYLEKCLNSIINQSIKDIEIICVDDGSTDKSLQILNDFAQRDSRIKIYCQPHVGGGAGSARNLGMSKACGETLLFLDADDEFDENLVKELYEKLEKEDADIAFCNFQMENKNSDICYFDYSDFIKNPIVNRFNYQNNLFSVAAPFVWNKMFRKSFIDKCNLQFMNTCHSNDIAFVFLAMAHAQKIVFVNSFLINYIKHENSTSSGRTGDNFCDVVVYKHIISELKQANLFNVLEKALYKIMLKSYNDALFAMCRRTKEDYIKTVKKMKELLPFKAIFFNINKSIGRRYTLIKFLPETISYYYFHLKKKF